MGFRTIVITSRSKLDYKMDYLVIRTEQKTKRIFLDEISILMIESTAVSLTAYLLAELTKKKIKVIFCDEKHNPAAELSSLYGNYNSSRRIQTQAKWNVETKDLVWAEIVRAKIAHQAAILPDALMEQKLLLTSYLDQVLPGDPTNREAHAAKVYFNGLFGLSFSRSDTNLINAALDYGYTILLSAFNREVVSCGYITDLGIFHRNMFNSFNLSCDLMEPFRPLIDRKVKELNLMQFEKEEKMAILNILNEKIRIDDTEQYVMNAIHIYTLSVLRAMEENDVAHLKFPDYE